MQTSCSHLEWFNLQLFRGSSLWWRCLLTIYLSDELCVWEVTFLKVTLKCKILKQLFQLSQRFTVSVNYPDLLNILYHIHAFMLWYTCIHFWYIHYITFTLSCFDTYTFDTYIILSYSRLTVMRSTKKLEHDRLWQCLAIKGFNNSTVVSIRWNVYYPPVISRRIPANRTNVGSMLVRRLRRGPNIDPILVQRLVFAGILLCMLQQQGVRYFMCPPERRRADDGSMPDNGTDVVPALICCWASTPLFAGWEVPLVCGHVSDWHTRSYHRYRMPNFNQDFPDSKTCSLGVLLWWNVGFLMHLFSPHRPFVYSKLSSEPSSAYFFLFYLLQISTYITLSSLLLSGNLFLLIGPILACNVTLGL